MLAEALCFIYPSFNFLALQQYPDQCIIATPPYISFDHYISQKGHLYVMGIPGISIITSYQVRPSASYFPNRTVQENLNVDTVEPNTLNHYIKEISYLKSNQQLFLITQLFSN